MKFDSPQNPIDMIEFIINSLIDFSDKNEYDDKLYNSFAKKKGKSFNRYFAQIDNDIDKAKIISDLKSNFHFSVRDIVSNMMATKESPIKNFEPGVTYYIGQPTPDNRIRGFEKNYLELMELFLDEIALEQPKQYKTSTVPDGKAQSKAIIPDEVEMKTHPKHDPNLWNKDCYELFKHLYDCYYKNTKRQITNIWFYLKENGNTKYILNATKEQYEIFILGAYHIKITNFDKAQTKWEDKEYDKIDEHRLIFEDNLK